MRKIAAVNTSGRVQNIIDVPDDSYPDGMQEGVVVYHDLPDGADHMDVLSSWVWTGSWQVVAIPPQPGPNYEYDAANNAWVDMRGLADVKTHAISKAFADVDKVYADAIGNRGTEYKEASDDARAFVAAGYTGTVSEYVSSYALHNYTGAAQTDQWAADQIIARADAFLSAQKSMRTNRFASQGTIQAAATLADVDAAVTSWDGYIAQLRTQLGL